jgi:putative heme transporter
VTGQSRQARRARLAEKAEQGDVIVPVPAHQQGETARVQQDAGPAAGPDDAGPVRDGETGRVAEHGTRHRNRLRVAAVIVIVVAVLTTVIVVNHYYVAKTLGVFGSLDWTWFGVAIGCEAVSLTAFGLSRRLLLRAEGHQASFRSVMAVTYASNALSMTIPFAGAELAIVFSFREFRRRGLGPAIAGWALTVSAILSTSALAVLLVAGAIVGRGSIAGAFGWVGAALFLVPAVAVLLGLRYQRIRGVLNQLLARLIGVSRRLIRWPSEGAAGALEATLERVASISMPWPRYAEAFGFALLNWLGDCACLACAIRATGQPVPWHVLLLVYAAGAAVGSTGLTPGGFGLVEAALTGALATLTTMSPPTALAAVLAYRLVSFWMILIGGWILMIILSRARSRAEVYARAPDEAVRQ